ncbi:LacI family DNA-binding transcriptional regulator [Microbacterium aurantiacum]|uniref:LacI family DNA-binding transcriptional regulator n=1 Tax=Microbacterium aurantiacum TaxID=162393 RepID=UPI003439FB24
MDPTSRRVRLADVAERAGVTKATVSRLLNQDKALSIRPETRRRVLDAVAALGYQPHAGARALARNETRALALIIPDLTNLTYSRIVRGAFRRAIEKGFVLLIAEDVTAPGVAVDGLAEEVPGTAADTAFADLVSSRRVDGLIVASAQPGDSMVRILEEQRIPHVFVNRAIPDSNRNVTMDVAAAGDLVIRHLTGLGHRRIAHIAGPGEILPSLERERAFLQSMAALGVDDPHVHRGAFSAEGGYRAALAMVAEDPGVTAIYVSTYVQAVGALKALSDFGLRVPEDVSVVSFDDAPQADFLTPPLTSVAMPLTELGAAAVDALVSQLAQQEPADVLLTTAPRLVLRASSAVAPTRESLDLRTELSRTAT